MTERTLSSAKPVDGGPPCAVVRGVTVCLPPQFVPTREQKRRIARLRSGVVNGIKIANPLFVVQAAVITHLPLSLACATLTDESSGGENLWGHDVLPNNKPKIFYDGIDAHGHHWGDNPVTEAAYREYARERYVDKKDYRWSQLQGVGPTQITDLDLQDAADALGGAWKPLPNLVVGFAYLAGLIRQNGKTQGLQDYNGSSAYPPKIEAIERKWAAILGTKISG